MNNNNFDANGVTSIGFAKIFAGAMDVMLGCGVPEDPDIIREGFLSGVEDATRKVLDDSRGKGEAACLVALMGSPYSKKVRIRKVCGGRDKFGDEELIEPQIVLPMDEFTYILVGMDGRSYVGKKVMDEKEMHKGSLVTFALCNQRPEVGQAVKNVIVGFCKNISGYHRFTAGKPAVTCYRNLP